MSAFTIDEPPVVIHVCSFWKQRAVGARSENALRKFDVEYAYISLAIPV